MGLDHKVIISGTGRAGTTFLIQLLTELGLDTGFSAEEVRRSIDQRSHAGLERGLRSPLRLKDLLRGHSRNPYIVKSPWFCETLGPELNAGRIVVDHAFIPMRELEIAALSRISVGGEGRRSGGLWKTDDPSAQKRILAENFFGLLFTLAAHDIPHTLLMFPRLVKDWAYTYHKLWFLVKEIESDRFREAFTALARPEWVHSAADFGNGSDSSDPELVQNRLQRAGI